MIADGFHALEGGAAIGTRSFVSPMIIMIEISHYKVVSAGEGVRNCFDLGKFGLMNTFAPMGAPSRLHVMCVWRILGFCYISSGMLPKSHWRRANFSGQMSPLYTPARSIKAVNYPAVGKLFTSATLTFHLTSIATFVRGTWHKSFNAE